jgi:predicted metal-dependent hydrolase
LLIDYDVIRSNRTSLGITVERDGSIVVNSPLELDDLDIEKQVWKKRLWIWEKLAIKKADQDNQVKKQFISGESFYYLGAHYRLEITEGDDTLKLKNGWFLLGRKHQKKAKECFKSWYSDHLKNKIHLRLKLFEQRLAIDMPDFRVMELGYRWGSCSKEGNLNFNWKIAMAPVGVIDYIIAHELAHLKEYTHNERFWKEVRRLMPDYTKHKEWLKYNGASLDL